MHSLNTVEWIINGEFLSWLHMSCDICVITHAGSLSLILKHWYKKGKEKEIMQIQGSILVAL